MSKTIGTPEISILMPVYNEERYLGDCVDSILNQSYQNFELIIIDDGSTDRTPAILRSLSQNSKILNLMPGKIGKNAALNLGYSHASGKWITYFSGDDIMPQKSLEYRVNLLKEYSAEEQTVMSYSRCRMISENQRYDGIELPKNKTKGSDSASMMMFSKSLANKIFPLPENLPNEDQWTSLISKYFSDVKLHIPEIVAHYRIHSGNSHRRDIAFSEYSEQYHRRFLVYSTFAESFSNELQQTDLIYLKQLANLEEARYSSKLFQIVNFKLPIREKIRALLYANSFLYHIRLRFYRYFSGW